MKKINLLIILCLLISNLVVAQNVGIGTIQPDESAILDLSSSSKGLLIPRMTSIQKSSILKPADGLMVYQTDLNSGLYVFNGSKGTWTPISTSGTTYSANSVAAAAWEVSGNTGITTANFIGTSAGGGNDFNFKVDGNPSGHIGKSNSSTFFGYGSGKVDASNTSSAFGYRALEANTTGSNNTAMGYISLVSNLTGYNNVAVGSLTMWKNTTGYNNLALGGSAMANNTTGRENVALGASSLNSNTTGEGNVAIGSSSLRLNTTANSNVGIGANSLYKNTTGSNNFGLGFQSLYNNTTGTGNLSIGYQAGFSNATGNSNVFIGYQAGFYETTNNKLYVANSLTATPLLYGDFSAKFISIGDIPAAKRDAVASAGQYGLLVKGGIMSEKVKVALSSSADWADYVFAPEYKLMPIEQVEAFTKENKHLPNVPSADEMAEEGLDVTKTSQMFMEKIEELSLYIIQLNNKVKELEKQIESLK